MIDGFDHWQSWASRVEVRLPFRVDVLVSIDSRPPPHGDRVQLAVELHVPDRDTREPITVRTRQHVGAWTNDDDACALLFELLEIALRHETREAVRLDGALVNDAHRSLLSGDGR